jgi:hypothetical protein
MSTKSGKSGGSSGAMFEPSTTKEIQQGGDMRKKPDAQAVAETGPPIEALPPPAGLLDKMVKVKDRDVTINQGDDSTGTKFLGGSVLPDFNKFILKSVMSVMADSSAKDEALKEQIMITCAALAAFKPTDEIEGMLASQAVALHVGAMECLRRAMIPQQPFEIATRMRKDGANMMRAMTDMLEALDRKRGKGPQVVRVERVVVNEGGQAIVGNVTPGVKA